MRERNEALDCRVYARAAAWILGADRWTEDTWASLEAQAGIETRAETTVETTTPATATAGSVETPRRRRQRSYTPKYME